MEVGKGGEVERLPTTKMTTAVPIPTPAKIIMMERNSDNVKINATA